MIVLEFLGIVLLFLFGLRASAFFSGSETGFYRASGLRVAIEARAGDPLAKKIDWFSQNPANFVATTLIGNNIANYVTTLAISLMAVRLFGEVTDAIDVMCTLAMTPVIFIFGELMPKTLYYLAPQRLLRRDFRLFTVIYYILLPVSLPLIWLTRALQRLGGGSNEQLGIVFRRSRLAHVLGLGQNEGVLSSVQNQLIHGMFDNLGQPVSSTMTPIDRIYDIDESADRETILEIARKYGLPFVLVRSSEASSPKPAWNYYYVVSELLDKSRPVQTYRRDLPRIHAKITKLQALQTLREADEHCALIEREGQVIGMVTQRGISEQMFANPDTTRAMRSSL